MKTTKLGKWVMAGLIAAAMAAPLPALAAQGAAGSKANTQVAQAQQVRPDCPNNGQQLRDGSGRTREGSLHQNRGMGLRDGSGRAGNRGAGLRNGTGPGNGAGNRGPAQS